MAEPMRKVREWLRAINSWDVLRGLFPWQELPASRLPLARREKVRSPALTRFSALVPRIPGAVWL